MKHLIYIRYILFILCIYFSSCQKEKDILNRTINPPPFRFLTTILSDNTSTLSDTVIWFQNANGKVDSAYSFDSDLNRRIKSLSVDRSTPGVVKIDDGGYNKVNAKILINGKGQPYKVEFYDRQTKKRLPHSYNFGYNFLSPYGLEYYFDSVPYVMTAEGYGVMLDDHYPNDSFMKVSLVMGNSVSEDMIGSIKWGDDLSTYSFVPFICSSVTSNLSLRLPSAICNDLFDAYIWGELIRPYLSDRIILGFNSKQLYPVKMPVVRHAYIANLDPKQITYKNDERTVINHYP